MICFQQELDLMEEGMPSFKLGIHVEIKAHFDTLGGVKCELEALYILGFSMVSDFVRTSACEGDFI